MQTLEYLYQESAIHFLVNPTNKNVMVNATEMAKIFDKRVDVFLKTDHAKAFIAELEFTPFGGNSAPLTADEIIQTRGHMGTYMHRILALKFAAWLSPKFEIWVYSTIETIVFGNYQKHWQAHAMQEDAKLEMERLKNILLENPSLQDVQAYFKAEEDFKNARTLKTQAIKNQLKLKI